MRNVIVIITFFHLSFSVFAQESSLELSSNIGLFNSSINEPSESYGFLDNTEKANIIAALKSKNYPQFEWDSEICISIKRVGIFIGNHAGLYAKYNQSLFS